MTLKEFLAEARRPGRPNFRGWVNYPGLKILYVRFGKRYIQEKVVDDVLDLATAEARVPGSGSFTNLIQHLQKNYPELTLYAENAHPRLGKHLQKIGFTRVEDTSIHEVASNYVIMAKAINSQKG